MENVENVWLWLALGVLVYIVLVGSHMIIERFSGRKGQAGYRNH